MTDLGKKYPTISIITPSYNQGQFIEQTILSVIGQNYPNLDYIIIDGGSTDQTLSIIKKYDSKINYWTSRPDNGQAEAINTGFSMAEGEIFMWLNSDDLLLKGSLHGIANAYRKTKKKKNFFGLGRRVYINKNSYVQGFQSFTLGLNSSDAIAWGISRSPHQEATCWSRYLWEEYGPLNEKINLAFDLDLFLRILGNEAKSVYIPDLIGAWRIWESNKCTIFSSQLNNEVNKVKNIYKRENSIYKNKIIKKLARKIVKISQEKFAMEHGLPKIGRIVHSKEKVNQLFIPFLWKIIINIKT